MQTTARLADYVCRTGYDDIDQRVIERAKELALSALGSAVLGSGMDVTRTMAEYAREAGGPQQAGVIGARFQTSVEWAAVVNCTAAHCTELEDVAWPEAMYTCFLFPTVFSLGEFLHASGRAVLEALVIGYEVAARQGTICTEGGGASRGWLTCAHLGAIGAAAAAAKLLGLNVAQTRNALSLAASMSAGLIRQTGSGAHVIEAGFAGRNGIMAAKLAQRGLTGNPTILEGQSGYWDALAGQPAAEFDLGHGADFRILAVGMKKYPCCYLVQRIVDGALHLRQTHAIRAQDVASVEVGVNETFPRVIKYPVPDDGEEARFSLQHVVAAALSGERMLVETFTREKAHDPALRALGERVKMIVHPDWEKGQLAGQNPMVVRLKNGTTYQHSCITAHGDSVDPLTRAEVIKKFHDSVQGLLPATAEQRVGELITDLESVADVAPMLQQLTHLH